MASSGLADTGCRLRSAGSSSRITSPQGIPSGERVPGSRSVSRRRRRWHAARDRCASTSASERRESPGTGTGSLAPGGRTPHGSSPTGPARSVKEHGHQQQRHFHEMLTQKIAHPADQPAGAPMREESHGDPETTEGNHQIDADKGHSPIRVRVTELKINRVSGEEPGQTQKFWDGAVDENRQNRRRQSRADCATNEEGPGSRSMSKKEDVAGRREGHEGHQQVHPRVPSNE